MTSPTDGYELQITKSHSILSFDPAIANGAWGDIERIGGELVTCINSERGAQWLIDLSRLEYMGSALVALVVRVWKAIQSAEGRVVVVCGDGMPQEVLKLAGLDKVWTIARTPEEGLQQLGVARSRSSGSPVLVLIAALAAVAAGIVLGLRLSETAVDENLAKAGLFGGAVVAVVLGGIACFRGPAPRRLLAGVTCLVAIAIAAVGYWKFPPF